MAVAQRKSEKDDKWLIEKIQALLISADSDSRDYAPDISIFLVPEGFKKLNHDVYMPRVVSIGPRFNDSRDELLLMEEVKLACMLSLLHRGTKTAYESLKECSSAISKLDELVRASYVVGIELTQPELTKIILLDGCFLLELLISNSEEYNSMYKSSLNEFSPAAEVLKDEDVLSDLMLFENQIPILVLHTLSQTLFPEVFDPMRRDEIKRMWIRTERINNLVLSVLGYSPHELPYYNAAHIIGLVHFYVNRSTPSQQEDHDVMDIIDTSQTRQQQLKLKRCALRLLTAGVTIKVKLPEDIDSNGFRALSCFSLVWNSLRGALFGLCNIFLVKGKHMDYIPEAEAKGLDFYFKFENRKLEIEQLHITKTTKAKWCNLIAWEHFLKQNTWNRCTGKFTWAALIFNSLICCEDDVQFLKDNKIVVDHTKMSNQNLVEFFRKIAIGVDHTVVGSGSYYTQIVYDINNFSKAFFIKRIWSMVWYSFTYHQEWFFKFFYHNYNFVATVISLCTVVQTIYAIIAYQLPKN